MSYEQTIADIVANDPYRMRALQALRSLCLPDAMICAGFVRNLVWDHLFQTHRPLNDIDVIYYCQKDCSVQRDLELEQKLRLREPLMPWSVKNQARMHLRNNDPVYQSSLDAMRYWPEKETAVGAVLDSSGQIIIKHCFDLESLFKGQITHNPAKPVAVFNERVKRKNWLTFWPKLRVNVSDSHASKMP
ncbi:nucleotidyltransferase family protein [Alginatibacterium sediminis]|uniref:Nucleotidyltransferase family protein n=1 Tax=Alginatibacterium sediminis TaxID=2164068 RepID=A0A420E7C0_9ALTE|nr:nucleotidyltransferase family protein [Alginatibacterium sediminis]RKF14289.1 nucleotidyltransferase family protein [Alginatibacterium sediminis]